MDTETVVRRKPGRPKGSTNKSRNVESGKVVELRADFAEGFTAEDIPLSEEVPIKPRGRPKAKRTLFDPGKPPNEELHEAIIGIFGIVNELLEKAGHYDLLESEVNLIFIPAERILARHNKLGAAGKISPNTLDMIQISVGLGSYGVRISPSVKSAIDYRFGKRKTTSTTGDGYAGMPTSTNSQSTVRTNDTQVPTEYGQSAIERYFAHVGEQSNKSTSGPSTDNVPFPQN